MLLARGVKSSYLYCFPRNEPALRFYERCGWSRQGVHGHQVQISGGRTEELQMMRLEKALRARLIVLTGGSGVGKTTLVESLAARGYPIVPEAAMQVIDALNGLVGPEKQLAKTTGNASSQCSSVLCTYGSQNILNQVAIRMVLSALM